MSNELTKKFEGFRSHPYLDEAGIPTIGYGTTRYTIGHLAGTRVTMNDLPITEKMGDAYLNSHVLMKIKPVIEKKLPHVPLNINQLQAMNSFIYNVGVGAFCDSTLLKKLRRHDFDGVGNEFLKWNKVTVNGEKKISNGLTKRREEERMLFLSPAYKCSAKHIPDTLIPKEIKIKKSFWDSIKDLFK